MGLAEERGNRRARVRPARECGANPVGLWDAHASLTVSYQGPSRARARGLWRPRSRSRRYRDAFPFPHMPSRTDRLAGGLWGLLVGDALGVPYEFHPPEALPPADRIEMEPPDGFERAHEGVPPGTWSDDGAQALALLDGLLTRGRLDLRDLGRRLVRWRDEHYMAVDGVFDVGMQTDRAISMLRIGGDPRITGPAREDRNGNGSLMRVLPLALWHPGSDAALVRDAKRQSLPTHGHLRSQVCCALYCLWARRLLAGASGAAGWDDAVAALRPLLSPEAAGELDTVLAYDGPLGTGYVVSCLHGARRALEAGPYEAVVKAAVAMGVDTDTTACVAGGLAGIRDGVHAIPERWLDALRGRAVAEKLLRRLLQHDERASGAAR